MKGVRKILSLLLSCVTVISVTAAFALVFLRADGYRPYSILSPSMTPSYAVGDLVYVKKADFSDIKKGDVITFVLDEKLNTATHRVERVNEHDKTFVTKGDANRDSDISPVMYENVVGTVRFKIPFVGYGAYYLSTASGRFALLSLLLVMLLIYLIGELRKTGKKKNLSEKSGGQK